MTAPLRVEITTAETDRLLREQIEDVVDALRGNHNPRRSDGLFRKYGNKGSLTVEVDGPNRGRITDFDGPNAGNGKTPLQFIKDELSCSWAGAYQWAHQFLGLAERDGRLVASRKARPRAQVAVDLDARAAKLAARYLEHRAALRPIAGTQAEDYLAGRVPGLDRATIPGCYRYRAPGATGGLGALGCVGIDENGTEACVQLVWLDGNGRKHPRLAETGKPTWGGGKGRPARLAARPDCLPALHGAVLLAEGPETALSVWVCTGAETWVVFGIGNFQNIPSVGNRRAIICRDLAPDGAQANGQVAEACSRLLARGIRAWVASPPGITGKPKEDFNDVHAAAGVEPVRRAILAAVPSGDGPLPPHFPEEPLAVEDAQQILRQTINGFIAAAVDYRRGFGGDAPPQLGIKAAAGLGKTAASIGHQETGLALAGYPGLDMVNVGVYVPNHTLVGEWVQRLRAAAPDRAVRIIRGREFKDADGPMCARADAAALVATNGFSVYEALCRRTIEDEHGDKFEELCPHYAACKASRYLSQFEDKSPAIQVMPNDYLVLPWGRQTRDDIAIVDERFWPKTVQHRSFGLDRLTANRSVRLNGRDISPDVADLRVMALEAHRALEEGRPLLAALRDAGYTSKDLRRAASTEWGGRDSMPVSPGMPSSQILTRLRSFTKGPASRLHRFWSILADEIDTGRDAPLGVELKRNAPVPGGKSGELQDRIVLHWRRSIRVEGVPVLALDADLDARIGRLFLPNLEVVEIPVARNAEVVQVVDSPCSMRRLLGTADLEDKARAKRRLLDVQQMIEREARSGRQVLVIATHEVAKVLNPVPNVEITWFGNIRGRDCWKGFDSVFLIGREQPRLDAVEAEARGLFYDQAEPMSFVQPDAEGRLCWAKERRGYRMREGFADALVDVHPDPRVQGVLEQIRECESTQGIDRVRPIHSPVPKRVFVVSNVVLNLTVDRLVRWNEMRPTRFDEAAARFGVLPLSPKELSRCFPDLWATATAAERDLARQPKTPTKTPIEYLLGNWWGFSARYRCPGARGPMTRVLVAGPVEGARDRVEELVGPVKEFELEEEGGGVAASDRSDAGGSPCDAGSSGEPAAPYDGPGRAVPRGRDVWAIAGKMNPSIASKSPASEQREPTELYGSNRPHGYPDEVYSPGDLRYYSTSTTGARDVD